MLNQFCDLLSLLRIGIVHSGIRSRCPGAQPVLPPWHGGERHGACLWTGIVKCLLYTTGKALLPWIECNVYQSCLHALFDVIDQSVSKLHDSDNICHVNKTPKIQSEWYS